MNLRITFLNIFFIGAEVDKREVDQSCNYFTVSFMFHSSYNKNLKC